MLISKNKLDGSSSNDLIEIIDLRYLKDENEKIIDNKSIFKGYHMNKRSWITIILDNSLNTSIIYEFIDNSYNLTTKKN